MYILGKLILGTQISMLGFLTNLENLDQYQVQLFFNVFHYSTLKWPKRQIFENVDYCGDLGIGTFQKSFFLVLTKVVDPQHFTFASENGQMS